MRLTILGGGGFRVPLVYRALALDPLHLVDEVVLLDDDPLRVRAIARVLQHLGSGPTVRIADGLDDALRATEVVFSAVRVGGASGRVRDERLSLDLGVLGQETTGPAGIAYALRTLPVATRIAQRVSDLAPSAWVLNFTNPAGMVTAAMQQILGDRVIGICDSPTGLVRRVSRAMGVDEARVVPGYAGLNHLGWLRSAVVDGVDLLPGLLDDEVALASFEEGRLFGPDLLSLLGCVPNEYLYYYYYAREATAAVRSADRTRGEVIADQQRDLYPRLAEAVDPLRVWDDARLAREQGYLAEARAPSADRDEADLAGGGYEQVALAAMRALVTGVPAELILNVRNGSSASGLPALAQLPADAVVEVPTLVDDQGPHPHVQAPFDDHQLSLVAALRAVETATVHAAASGSRTAALRAFTVHPLVDSAALAQELLAAYLGQAPDRRTTAATRPTAT